MSTEAADAFRRHLAALTEFERRIDELRPKSRGRIRQAFGEARADGQTILASIEIATKQITPEDRR